MSRGKELQGRIIFTRPSNGNADEEEYIRITVEDEASHMDVVEIHVPLANFSKALTAQSASCSFSVSKNPNIGKRMITKYEIVPVPDRVPYGKAGEPIIREALKPFEVDGWVADASDASNHHRKVGYTKDGFNNYRVLFRKYVDPNSPEAKAYEGKD